MANYTIRLTKLHDTQRVVYEDTHQFVVLCAGRRYGKTVLARMKMFQMALKHGGEVWYIVPTFIMSTHMWNKIKADVDPGIIQWKSENERTIVFKNGGVIKIFSASSSTGGEGMRGNSADFVVFDEAAMIPKLQDIFENAVVPALTDRNGKALFISTPRGTGDYFHQLYERGLDESGLFDNYSSYHFTSYDNPFIDNNIINQLKMTMTQQGFEQEYMAKFVSEAGAVFRGLRDVCVLDVKAPYNGEFVFGIDFGRHNDWTVISVFDIKDNCMVDMERFNKISFPIQLAKIERMYEKWKPITIGVEANSFGETNYEFLLEKNLPVERFYTTLKSKQEIIDLLASDIEHKRLYLLNDPEIFKELQAYQSERTVIGNIKYGAPRGFHDDTVMSIAIGNYYRHNFVSTYGTIFEKIAGWN